MRTQEKTREGWTQRISLQAEDHWHPEVWRRITPCWAGSPGKPEARPGLGQEGSDAGRGPAQCSLTSVRFTVSEEGAKKAYSQNYP